MAVKLVDIVGWIIVGIGYLAISFLIGLLAAQKFLMWFGSKIYGFFHKPHKVKKPEL